MGANRVKQEDIVCTDCGAVYEVEMEELKYREKGSFYCVCGNHLKSWNGGLDLYFTPKECN